MADNQYSENRNLSWSRPKPIWKRSLRMENKLKCLTLDNNPRVNINKEIYKHHRNKTKKLHCTKSE